MTKVTVDQAALAKVFDPSRISELCDESGRAIGLFMPISAGDAELPLEGECPLSEDEIQLLKKQPQGRPLSEIWRDLGVKR